MTPKTHPTPAPRPARDPQPRGVLCPFCGEVSPDVRQCRGCRAFLDPLSRQATQNEMGPWAIRDPAQPFRPGCSFGTIRRLVERGRIGPMTVIRGPTTRQAWSFAGRTPSVANLLGLCHNCRKTANPDDPACLSCGASFAPETDRQRLGLAPVHLLPGQASPEAIASAAVADRADRSPPVAQSPPPATAPSRAASPASEGDQEAPGSAADGDVAALRARVARLRAAVVLLIASGALVATLAASITGVLRWPASNAPTTPPGVAPDSTPMTQPQPTGEEPARPANGDEHTGEQAAPSDAPANSDPEPADTPEEPLSTSPSRAGLLDAALGAADAEPADAEALLGAVVEMQGQDSDTRAWLEAARRRVVLRKLRGLP